MNALCVVKQFSPSPQIQTEPEALKKATKLFNQEAVRLFELGEHPQMPKLFAHFEQDKQLYLVQEFIDGQTLLAQLRQQSVFNEGKICQLLADLPWKPLKVIFLVQHHQKFVLFLGRRENVVFFHGLKLVKNRKYYDKACKICFCQQEITALEYTNFL